MTNEQVTKLIEEVKALPEFNVEFDFLPEDELIYSIGEDTENPNAFYVYETCGGMYMGEVYKFSEARQQFYSKTCPAINPREIISRIQKDMQDYAGV